MPVQNFGYDARQMITMKEILDPYLLCAQAEETTQYLFFDSTYSSQQSKLQCILSGKRGMLDFITILLDLVSALIEDISRQLRAKLDILSPRRSASVSFFTN
ncbi:hypothetical protein Bca4012_083599 [Brassica carinata]